MLFIIGLYDAHIAANSISSVRLSEVVHKKDDQQTNTVRTWKKQHRKRRHVPALFFNQFSDILTLSPPSPPPLSSLLPSSSFLGKKYRAGAVCVVYLLVCLEKKNVGGRLVGFWFFRRIFFRSHLRLQVHDLLTHQRDGGAVLLPLHCLQLQRGGRHSLQVLPHPGRRGVGLPDALPRPLTGGLLLVLMRQKERLFLRQSLISAVCHKSICPTFFFLRDSSKTILVKNFYFSIRPWTLHFTNSTLSALDLKSDFVRLKLS